MDNQNHIEEPNTNSMEVPLKRIYMPKNKLAMIVHGPAGIEYCCVECPAKYSDKEKLELHLVMHNQEYRFLCGICGTGLKRKEHLDRHILGHQEVRPHICPECGKGFKRKEHLNIHRSIHSGDKNQVCPLCQRSFYRKDHLQKHLQTHSKLFLPLSDQEMVDIKNEVDEDVKPILTDNGNCESLMEIEDENALLEPRPIKVDSKRPFACDICDKTYKRKDHLKMHSATHAQNIFCSECGKGFNREEQLLSHMSVHLKLNGFHDNGPELASVQTLLEQHTNIKILPLDESLLVPRSSPASESRPHECPICHRKFKRKQHLKVHANVHTKQQQPTIWCSLCDAGFQSNFQFENHECMTANHYSNYAENCEEERLENVPHEAKKENNYPPEFVEMLGEAGAYGAYEGSQPAEYVVEEASIPTPQRVYVCKYCNKPFKRKDHYKIHLHIHTGVKSFFCPDCGKGFYRKDHLQKHSTVHQKGKPRPKKEMPDLYPIGMLPAKKEVKPEITITAPSNTRLRVPLQMKVPYQMVMSTTSGERRAVTIDPSAGAPRPQDLAA